MLKYVAILVVTLGIVALLIIYTGDMTEHKPPSKVIALPADYNEKQIYPPYSGLHPSKLKRPDETYRFPIEQGSTGPVKPLFAGPLQYPFLCQTEEAKLGQPLVDNQEGAGMNIFKLDDKGEKTSRIIGYSKDCLLPTQIFYMARRKGNGTFQRIDTTLENVSNDPADETETITINGQEVKFIVRIETGTINRHPYMISMLKGESDTIGKPDPRYWNNKLIYQFRGGVGVGKQQGQLDINNILRRRQQQLADGYAVIHSTANQTSNTYNIWLSEDTALRVKQQFISQFGKPEYTVGIGGSGGAIQQYLLAQNNPDILDAAIALYSYPDMLTQTPYILDCELLEYFFDVTDSENAIWKNWDNRNWIEGMNSDKDAYNKYNRVKAYADLLKLKWPNFSPGATECTLSWRGLGPVIFNPKFPVLSDHFSPEVQAKTQLSHWDDLKYFYGADEQGNPNFTWDNTGVQYGLDALKKGNINIKTFLKLNTLIGGWKKPQNMEREHYWFFNDELWPGKFSLWSHHNMNLSSNNKEPAPRTAASIKAIEAAYRSGQIFIGHIDAPIIDLRHYMDDELNMHHSFTSFSTRARIITARGHADNHIIWQTKKPHTLITEAFQTIDRWMQNIKYNPDKTVVENKPADAVDHCYNDKGELIAKGHNVWDGKWNNKKDGACTKAYPPYKTSRMVAGENISGDVLKCQLQSVKQAIEKGVYSPINMTEHQRKLENIFPEGICDYSKPDMGRPADL
jgi:hypothetical protein